MQSIIHVSKEVYNDLLQDFFDSSKYFLSQHR